MSAIPWCRIGWVPAEHDGYAPYFEEALAHAGLPYQRVEQLNEFVLAKYDVLLFCGYGDFPTALAVPFAKWVGRGGQAVFAGSSWGLSALLGLEPLGDHISVGWIAPAPDSRLWPPRASRTKCFGGTRHRAAGAEVEAVFEDGSVAASRRSAGNGTVWFCGAHVGQTIALMQFGRSVETDGIGPADGSARLDDGILRAEDGSNLDFHDDREIPDGCAVPVFGHPHADVVRELWTRCVVEALERSRKPWWTTWPWPDGAEAAGLLTVECPTPDEEALRTVSKVASNVGARPTWLVGTNGFSSDIYRAMHGSMQEVGILFEPPDGAWEPERLRIQHLAVCRAAAFPRVDAVRAGNGQWRGHLRPYEMAARAGAALSVAKGGRQAGTAGYLFGSCCPLQARNQSGEAIPVFEAPYAAYLPGFPDAAAEALVAQAQARNGCFHVAADLVSLLDPTTMASFRRLLVLAKQEGVRFLLPSEIARHLEQRRLLRASPFDDGKNPGMSFTSTDRVEGLTLLFGGLPEFEADVSGNPVKLQRVSRHGVKLWAAQVDLEGKRTLHLRIHPSSSQAAA